MIISLLIGSITGFSILIGILSILSVVIGLFDILVFMGSGLSIMFLKFIPLLDPSIIIVWILFLKYSL